MTDRPDGALYIKYRPQSFEEVMGNEETINSLKLILSRTKDKVHSFLLHGPAGCGKTTIARLIAKELGCSDYDFLEYNSANTRGIETIRHILSTCRLSPIEGESRIYLLDESHKLTNDAQNSLLKILEDTPGHVYFILCTTDPEKLIKTVRSRCMAFQVNSLSSLKVISLLKWVCKNENVEIGAPVLKEIVRICDGSPRQALVFLDQVIDCPTDSACLEALSKILVSETDIRDICQLLLSVSKENKWTKMSKMIKGLNQEPESVRYAILGYMAEVLLNREQDGRIPSIIELFLKDFMYTKKAGLIQALYLACQL